MNFTSSEIVEVGREERFERFSIEVVFRSDLDGFQVVQHVQLGQVERSVTVDQGRVLHNDQI